MASTSGYIIPKGWRVLTWFRSVHLDSEIYDNPLEFKPERWEVSCFVFTDNMIN
jgi:ent-kaurenoic acid hydroxylase